MVLDTAGTRDWGYALIFLAMVSALFLVLRFSGRAFVVLDFEIFVIYTPTAICLLIYAAKLRSALFSRPATRTLPETRA